jgi:hypothetical protein
METPSLELLLSYSARNGRRYWLGIGSFKDTLEP